MRKRSIKEKIFIAFVICFLLVGSGIAIAEPDITFRNWLLKIVTFEWLEYME